MFSKRASENSSGCLSFMARDFNFDFSVQRLTLATVTSREKRVSFPSPNPLYKVTPNARSEPKVTSRVRPRVPPRASKIEKREDGGEVPDINRPQ